MQKIAALLLFAGLFLCPALTFGGQEAPRRVGIFIAAKQGNIGEPDLLYSDKDAYKLFQALVLYGDLDQGLSRLVLNRDLAGIRSSFAEFRAGLTSAATRDEDLECIFYYSGHGGIDGLHVANHQWPYSQLVQDLDDLPCKFTVVILDACNSGSINQVKGFTTAGEPEEYRLKLFTPQNGRVFISSSAGDELSQESMSLKGSVFTFHFVNALLGEGDDNRDKLVTLDEAYTHAFRNTLSTTFSSSQGLQIPSYNYEMRGSTAFIMTRFQGLKANVRISQDLRGTMTFLDRKSGLLWGNFQIRGKGPVQLSLPEGSYMIRFRSDQDNLFLGSLTISRDTRITRDLFTRIDESKDPFKGRRSIRDFNFLLTGGGMMPSNSSLAPALNGSAELSLLIDDLLLHPLFGGFTVRMFQGSGRETALGVPINHEATLLTLTGNAGLMRVFGTRLTGRLGLELGAGWSFADWTFESGEESRSGAFFTTGLDSFLSWRVAPGLSIIAPRISGSMFLFRNHGSLETTFLGSLTLGLMATL